MKQGKIMKRWANVIDKLHTFGKSKCGKSKHDAQTAARAILLACREHEPPDEVYVSKSKQSIVMRWPGQIIEVFDDDNWSIWRSRSNDDSRLHCRPDQQG